MKVRLFITLIFLFFMCPLMQAEATPTAKKPLFTQQQKELMKKSLKVALYTLESSVGLLLSFVSAVFAKDLLIQGKTGYADPLVMAIAGIAGIPLSAHGLIRLYQELNIAEQIKTVSELLKKQLHK